MNFASKTALAVAALTAGLSLAGAASANVVFYEGFNNYTFAIANGATSASANDGNSLTTSYSYRVPGLGNGPGDANSMYDEGTWTIAANPLSVHNLWVDLGEGYDDPMLMLNGKVGANGVTPAESYTSGAIAVSAGSYDFSYDLMNLCCNGSGPSGTQSFLQFLYSNDNGATFTSVLGTDVAPVNPGVFANQTGSFTLASGGQLKIRLVDSQGAASGNDFGIDNITVTAVPEPGTWALMILGFGSAGAMLRRRRSLAVA